MNVPSPPSADAGGSLRLFFALWPDGPVRDSLAAAGAALALPPGARQAARDALHLTVAFVGSVPAPALERVRGIGAALRAAPAMIELDTYEYWPKPEVVVALARAIPPPLQALWDELHARLAAAGFDLRVKQLRPHVTLARHVSQPPSLSPLRPLAWHARELCLVRSVTGGSQSVYTVLDTWPLLDKPVPR